MHQQHHDPRLLHSRRPIHGNVLRLADWTHAAIACELTADQLLQRYCTWSYHHTRSYEASARQLGLDRRTVKAKVDPKMLEKLQTQATVKL